MEVKPINGYDGYFITSDGRVLCNLGKGNRNRSKTVEPYELQPRLTKTGYARVYMRDSRDGKRKDEYIHRIVAEHFIPNPDGKKYVNHKNCIRDDNSVENLEWVTAKENTDYTMSVGHNLRDEKGRYVSNFKYN